MVNVTIRMLAFALTVWATLFGSTLLAASPMRFEHSEGHSTYDITNEGGLWKDGAVAYSMHGREFGAGEGTADVPLVTDFSFARNIGASGDVVAGLWDADCEKKQTICFGGNLIVRSGSGAIRPKLVGLEIDIEPARGVLLDSGSGGLFLNAFNSDAPVAVQIGGVSGGSFTNGIVMGQIIGAGLSGQAGATLGSLINTGNAKYTDDSPIVIGFGQRIKFTGPNGKSAYLFSDNEGRLHFEGSGFDFSGPTRLGRIGFAALGSLNAALGDQFFCIDCLEPGQVSGRGTGIPIFFNGNQWRSMIGGGLVRQ